jgi:ABC-type transport system involved in Fe-S cluster assembly fused permease/ATPase subunit
VWVCVYVCVGVCVCVCVYVCVYVCVWVQTARTRMEQKRQRAEHSCQEIQADRVDNVDSNVVPLATAYGTSS